MNVDLSIDIFLLLFSSYFKFNLILSCFILFNLVSLSCLFYLFYFYFYFLNLILIIFCLLFILFRFIPFSKSMYIKKIEERG